MDAFIISPNIPQMVRVIAIGGAVVTYYLRPGGVDFYLRPGGVNFYQRP